MCNKIEKTVAEWSGGAVSPPVVSRQSQSKFEFFLPLNQPEITVSMSLVFKNVLLFSEIVTAINFGKQVTDKYVP